MSSLPSEEFEERAERQRAAESGPPQRGALPTFAHSLRNPLAYVISNLDYALQHLAPGAGADEVRAALEEARAGAARMADLLNDPMAVFRLPGA